MIIVEVFFEIIIINVVISLLSFFLSLRYLREGALWALISWCSHRSAWYFLSGDSSAFFRTPVHFSKFPFFQSFLERPFTPSPFLAFRGSSTPSNFQFSGVSFHSPAVHFPSLWSVSGSSFCNQFFPVFPVILRLLISVRFPIHSRVSSHSVCWHFFHLQILPCFKIWGV